MLLISGSLFVLNAETPVTPIKATPSKLSFNSNLRNQIDIRDLKFAVENLTKDINSLKADVQKLKEQAVGKKEDPTPPKDLEKTDENIDDSTLLSEIKKELYSDVMYADYVRSPKTHDALGMLECKLLGPNPHFEYPKKVTIFSDWAMRLKSIKTNIPDSLKKDFTARFAKIVKARPNYQEFITAYINAEANDKKKAEVLNRRLITVLVSLANILKHEFQNNPIFYPAAYPDIDADANAVYKECQEINGSLPQRMGV